MFPYPYFKHILTNLTNFFTVPNEMLLLYKPPYLAKHKASLKPVSSCSTAALYSTCFFFVKDWKNAEYVINTGPNDFVYIWI